MSGAAQESRPRRLFDGRLDDTAWVLALNFEVARIEIDAERDAGQIPGEAVVIVHGMEEVAGGGRLLRAEVPLAEMFGYATALRSLTQGRATFSMEFLRYARLPANLANAMLAGRSKR